MIITVLFLSLFFIFIPSHAFAWGPLTHMYLGSEILTLASVLPTGIYKLLKRYREDFLYGNLMADIIIGKNLLPQSKNPHSWDVAFNLFDAAETPQQKAFVYGYMNHLAADTIAHEKLTHGVKYTGHTILEMKSDSLVGRKYWFMAVSIKRGVQRRNDIFLESTLESPFFSVKTNKHLYKGMVLLTGLTPSRMSSYIDRSILFTGSIPTSGIIKELHKKSLERMMDVLIKGECSKVIGKNPIAHIQGGTFNWLLRGFKADQ